ncbi:MAG: queuosine precursor transporter [Minisyncoccia bacterium]
MSEKDYKKILICLTLYVGSLFASNTLGIKLMPFLFGTHISVAVFSFPIVFCMTDVIAEVYGKKMANSFVWAGIISIVLFLFYSLVSTVTPWAKESLWAQAGYNQIFGLSARFSIASLAAFAIGQYQDVISFFFLKKQIGEKKFWLRANLANAWSELFDTVVFMSIAYVGIYPIHTIMLIIIPWWLYKIFMGFLLTPLSYLGIHILKNYGN